MLFCSLSLLASSQDKEFLFQKSAKQKKAGVILLSTGGAFTITGVLISIGRADNELINAFSENKNDQGFVAGTVLLLTGCAAMLSSIPLFVAANKNYRKASATVSLDFNRTPIPGLQKTNFRTSPALAIRLGL